MLPREPLLLGHSMGGLVAARAVLDGSVLPPVLVLSSPALRSRESPRMIRLASTLSRLAPALPLRNGLDASKLSHDFNDAEPGRSQVLMQLSDGQGRQLRH